jgi:hypothetical protein
LEFASLVSGLALAGTLCAQVEPHAGQWKTWVIESGSALRLPAPPDAAGTELGGMFDHVLSTDRVKVYRPDLRAYRMGIEALDLKPEQILFAAFSGWDAAGAKSFGYQTFWVYRQDQPAEELGVAADACGRTLEDPVAFRPRTTNSFRSAASSTRCSPAHATEDYDVRLEAL